MSAVLAKIGSPGRGTRSEEKSGGGGRGFLMTDGAIGRESFSARIANRGVRRSPYHFSSAW